MNKFLNKKVYGYDSKKEYRRFKELELMQKAGAISDLKTQVPFELIPRQEWNGKFAEHPVKYIADFTYYENGEYIVEDCKSPMTRKLPEFVIKRKLMMWVHRIKLRIT